MKHLIAGIFALAFSCSPALAQSCNDPSGFLKTNGPIALNDVLILGPGCQQVQDGGALPHSPIVTYASTVLGSDIALNNAGTFFDGPLLNQGSIGTWWVSGTATVTDTAGASGVKCKLWDGTTVISSGQTLITAVNQITSLTLSGSLATPAASLKISCQPGTTTGVMKFNATGTSKDTSIYGVRVQ